MAFRKAIFWLHLISGIVTGIIVLIMSVTGVALTYRRFFSKKQREES